MKTQNLKVGDFVYAVNNSVWGIKPMRVTRLYSYNTIGCEHPAMGSGAFCLSEVALVTKGRTKALREYRKAVETVTKLKARLFD